MRSPSLLRLGWIQPRRWRMTLEIQRSDAPSRTRADVTVAVKEWSERFAFEATRSITWACATDAVPDELADEALVKVEPRRLSIALVAAEHCHETAQNLFERLDCLFPGAAIVSATLAKGEKVWLPQKKKTPIAGAVLVDAEPLMVSRSVSKIAPGRFRANKVVADELFVHKKMTEEEPRTVEDFVGLPVFALPQVVVFPDQLADFNVFESRYKLMIKECQETSRPFLVADDHDKDTDDVLATACHVIDVDYSTKSQGGESKIVVKGSTRVRIRLTPPDRSQFNLIRSQSATVLSDDDDFVLATTSTSSLTADDEDERASPADAAAAALAMRQQLREAYVKRLRDHIQQLFFVIFGAESSKSLTLESLKLYPPLSTADRADWEHFTWVLAAWFHPYVQVARKKLWLSKTDTLDRLESMLDTLEVMVAEVKEQYKSKGQKKKRR